MKTYLDDVRKAVRTKHTRREIRFLAANRHGLTIPKAANLRDWVSTLHAHQQAINAGESPSKFWRRAHAKGIDPGAW